jgi:hypothetical protein
VAIAETLGWKGPFGKCWLPDYGPEGEDVHEFAGTHPDGERTILPNYPNCLNAMKEAEGVLTSEQYGRYWRDLWLVCENEFYTLESSTPTLVIRRIISATATQRSEAFLRTLNLWTDSSPAPKEEA